MKKELILQLRSTKDISFLNDFGDVLFFDDISDIVVILCDPQKIDDLARHPFVKSFDTPSTNGNLLQQAI